jgi:hypothetical protein
VRRELLVAAAGDPSLAATADRLGEWDETKQNERSHAAIPRPRHFSVTLVP